MEEIMKRQVANYIVERVDDKVIMRTVSGKWSVSVDAFSMRGAFLIECLNSGIDDLLECIVRYSYVTTTAIPDIEFMNDIGKAFEELTKRTAKNLALAGIGTEDTELKDLEDAKEKEMIKQEADEAMS